jgi:hypothetical protein
MVPLVNITDSVNARAGGQHKIGRANQGKVEKACSTAKLEAAVNRKSLNQTGGGPALPAPSEVTQQIIELHTAQLHYRLQKPIRIDQQISLRVVNLYPVFEKCMHNFDYI